MLTPSDVRAIGSDDRQRVDRDTAVAIGADEHRVQVHLPKLGQLNQQPRHANDHLGRSSDIDGRATAERAEQRRAAQFAEHRPGFVGIDRREPGGDIPQRLGQHATEPDDDNRAEERVVAPADD